MIFRRSYSSIRGCARRTCLSSSFKRCAALFLIVVLLLLALYALALVHEIIPGLCIEDGQEECPFCKLAHGIVLVLPALLGLTFTVAACSHIERPVLHPIAVHACYRLRAPPITGR